MDAFDLASVGIRSAAFVFGLSAVGLGWFALGCCRDVGDAARVRSWARGAALVAAVLVATHRLLDAGRMAGQWAGLFDPQLQALVWHHRAGVSTIVCVTGLVIAAARSGRIAAFGGVLVVASFGVTGHATEATHAHLLEALLAVHVGLIAFWFGGVVGLLRVRADLSTATDRFSRRAGWLVPWTLPIGLALICGLLPGPGALLTTYGAFLLAKLLGFLVVLVLAAVNRLRVVPALASGAPGAGHRLRRIALCEVLVLGSVLVVTAAMTSLFSWK